MYPQAMFDQAREIINVVKDYYGRDVVEESGQAAPEEVTDALEVGEPLPEGAETRDLPRGLEARLPSGVEWVAVGEHLIALDAADNVREVYYEMLPLGG
jgi:hypothetical protein